MNKTVTFRLDPETARTLKELTARSNGSRTQAIKDALRARRQALALSAGPTAWETYRKLNIPQTRGPKRDRARHASKLLKEILGAKHRAGTL
jgi:hypothetical protein